MNELKICRAISDFRTSGKFAKREATESGISQGATEESAGEESKSEFRTFDSLLEQQLRTTIVFAFLRETLEKIGRGGGIRTHDLFVPNEAR